MSSVSGLGGVRPTYDQASDNGLAPQTEARLRAAVNTGENPAKLAENLKKTIDSLPPNERDILAGVLSDSNDPLSIALGGNLGVGLSVIQKMVSGQASGEPNKGVDLGQEPMDLSHFEPKELPVPLHGDPIEPKPVFCYGPSKLKGPDERAAAAQGDPEALESCNLSMTIDQWNYYRTQGSENVKGMDPVTAQKTEEMLAALGGDRGKMISASEYNKLMQGGAVEAGGPDDSVPIDGPVIPDPEPEPVEVTGEGKLFQGARLEPGSEEAAGIKDELTLDQWNYYRTAGDEDLGVKAQEPLTPEQTEAMLQELGVDRGTPIPLSKYLELVGKTSSPSVSEETKTNTVTDGATVGEGANGPAIPENVSTEDPGRLAVEGDLDEKMAAEAEQLMQQIRASVRLD